MSLTYKNDKGQRDWKNHTDFERDLSDNLLLKELCSVGFKDAHNLNLIRKDKSTSFIICTLEYNNKQLRVSWEEDLLFFRERGINISVLDLKTNKTLAYFPTELHKLWKGIRDMWEEEVLEDEGPHTFYWEELKRKAREDYYNGGIGDSYVLNKR